MVPLRGRLAGDSDESPDPLSGFRWYVVAHRTAHPELDRLNRTVRETFRKLVSLLPVVIISGRVPNDLRRRVGLPEVCYVGHHGLSCLEAGGSMTWLTTPPQRTLVRRWVQALRIAAEGIEGAFVEDKGVTVALHDRLVKPKQRSQLRRRARRLLAPWLARGSVRLLRGHRVLEARSSSAEVKAQRCRCCYGDRGHVIECRSILGTIIRISRHSPWYRAEDLRFESAGDVARPVKMPGSLIPSNSTQFWAGWQQDSSVGKPTLRDAACVSQGSSEPSWGEANRYSHLLMT